MLVITNPTLFTEVVEEAKAKTLGDSRWVHALERADREIRENPMLHWQAGTASLLILSPISNQIYEANGVCQCKAYEFHQACWHRAAARLWKRYLEALARLPRVATENLRPGAAWCGRNQLKEALCHQ